VTPFIIQLFNNRVTVATTTVARKKRLLPKLEWLDELDDKPGRNWQNRAINWHGYDLIVFNDVDHCMDKRTFGVTLAHELGHQMARYVDATNGELFANSVGPLLTAFLGRGYLEAFYHTVYPRKGKHARSSSTRQTRRGSRQRKDSR
jgi:hypothetical protein